MSPNDSLQAPHPAKGEKGNSQAPRSLGQQAGKQTKSKRQMKVRCHD